MESTNGILSSSLLSSLDSIPSMVEITPTKTKTSEKDNNNCGNDSYRNYHCFSIGCKQSMHSLQPLHPSAGPTMLKLTTPNAPVVIPLVKGLYDGKDILLITTEVSDKAMKDQIGNFTGFPVNYAANLTQSQDIGNLWIFKNGVKGPGFMGFQASVVDSIPGDPNYTPLWKVSIVEWKTTSGTTPTILGSDDAIADPKQKAR